MKIIHNKSSIYSWFVIVASNDERWRNIGHGGILSISLTLIYIYSKPYNVGDSGRI